MTSSSLLRCHLRRPVVMFSPHIYCYTHICWRNYWTEMTTWVTHWSLAVTTVSEWRGWWWIGGPPRDQQWWLPTGSRLASGWGWGGVGALVWKEGSSQYSLTWSYATCGICSWKSKCYLRPNGEKTNREIQPYTVCISNWMPHLLSGKVAWTLPSPTNVEHIRTKCLLQWFAGPRIVLFFLGLCFYTEDK